MIYFIHDTEKDRVKIGYASDPWRRLTEIRTTNSATMELIGVEDGGRHEEAALHRRFSASHLRREWFEFSDDLRGYVSKLRVPEKAVPHQKTKSFWGMTAVEVARKTGLSVSFICRIRTGETRVSPDAAIRIQRATGMSAIKLVFGDLYEEAA